MNNKVALAAVFVGFLISIGFGLATSHGVVDGKPLTEAQAVEYCIDRHGYNSHIDNAKNTQEALTNFANSAGKLTCSIDSAN